MGVVGHRRNRLGQANPAELADVLRTILNVVKGELLALGQEGTSLLDDAGPVLRAISPLAEGTDRLFAEQAIVLGFELCCVMPFPEAEFERDFAEDQALE